MRIFYLTTIILIIVLATTITELYLGYVGLGDPIRYDSNYIYGYAPKENQKKQRLKGSIVSINDVGLRSNYNWKNTNKDKIIFLGDSITYGGSYIDDKETFSYLVCKELKNYLCGNAGVNAYSIINIVMRSKFDKRFADAKKYIFLVAPGDFYREYAGSNSAHFYLNNNKFFLPAITEAISFVATKYDLNKYISKKNDTKVYQNKQELINYSMELVKNEINRLKKLNKEVYLIYTIERDDKNSKKEINNYILNKLKALNIENFTSLENVLDKNIFFYDGIHYSKEGHNVVAKKIISIL